MAFTTISPSFSGGVRGAFARVDQKLGGLKIAIERRRLFTRIRKELSNLSDRDLTELGIPRSHITRLAWETAYGR
ncbi:DUF1127 domain-containing protein [Roseovarius aquimarinus]|uniref:DUF1127 domain-containing protein n=1 Tax=Roseovarius aquimarinus TaxID=1229156 RepID=A0ABW7I672_9RHOB